MLLNFLKWRFLKKDLRRIRLIVFDVDGVLTDGGLYFDHLGNLTKRFDVKDGLGIRLLKNEGIKIAFLSGGQGGSTESRAKQLSIDKCLVGVKDKGRSIFLLQKELKISTKETCYVGDDLNDIPVKNYVSLLIAPSNACSIMKKKSDLILTNNGGAGAVRELAKKVLEAKGAYKDLTKFGWKEKND